MSKPDYIFVYGTLRSDTHSDSYRQFMAPGFTLVSRATMPGRLYLIDYYPGLLPAENATDIVTGEVHAFSGGEEFLAQLDEYECCAPHSPQPHLYTRTREKALLEDGTTVEAWTYFYKPPVSKDMLIRSGDFLDPF